MEERGEKISLADRSFVPMMLQHKAVVHVGHNDVLYLAQSCVSAFDVAFGEFCLGSSVSVVVVPVNQCVVVLHPVWSRYT